MSICLSMPCLVLTFYLESQFSHILRPCLCSPDLANMVSSAVLLTSPKCTLFHVLKSKWIILLIRILDTTTHQSEPHGNSWIMQMQWSPTRSELFIEVTPLPVNHKSLNDEMQPKIKWRFQENDSLASCPWKWGENTCCLLYNLVGGNYVILPSIWHFLKTKKQACQCGWNIYYTVLHGWPLARKEGKSV